MIALTGNLLSLLAVAILLHVFSARVLGGQWVFVGDVLGAMLLILGGGIFLRNRRAERGSGRERGEGNGSGGDEE